MVESRPYLLKNPIQHYEWGTRGEDAFIPNLLGFEAENNRPYAELWMGSHPKASSEVILEDKSILLNQLILQHPIEILGKKVAKKFSGKLPFLFKVLSAGEILSIQAHPNKAQAKWLHERDPEHYPDGNHKPEVAIALDSLTALVGFKSFPDILQTLERYPEMTDFIGRSIFNRSMRSIEPSSQGQRELVRELYSTLLIRSVTHGLELEQSINQLNERLCRSRKLRLEEELFIELREKYTGPDVGLFTIFLLNLIQLKKGQGVFLKAGIPHAYLKGNIVECMANSDNVVRVGLTPKFTDVKTLIDILTYELHSISVLGEKSDLREIVYETPAHEFQVSRCEIESDQKKVEITGYKPEILLVTEGQIRIHWENDSKKDVKIFKKGQSILIPALLREYRIHAECRSEYFKVEVPI